MNQSSHLPLISVVTPSFQQGDFIAATMRSVLNQRYPNFEYIVVDGGSTDSSVEVIRSYEKRLRYWCSEPDKGHADAINKGFSYSGGEIMAWLNSDDMYLPWTFQAVADIFAQFPEVSWITGMNASWSDRGVMTKVVKGRINKYDYMLGNYHWIQQESVFWRRSLWERSGAGLNTTYKFMVDGELWSRFFQHEDLYYADCLLGGYREHSTNRAKLYATDCEMEMLEVINKMEVRLSSQERGDLRDLRRLRRLLSSKLPGRWRLVQMLASGRLKPLFERCGYTDLRFMDGQWRKCAVPFESTP